MSPSQTRASYGQARSTHGDTTGVSHEWRQTVTTLAGIVSVLLVAVGLFLTNAANRAQQRLTEQGQVTDRFGRAIDQLGSDKPDLRLGGIYSLERLMRDSPGDEANIIQVLSAYVRDHTPTPYKHPTVSGQTPWRRLTATDVQAALSVLARRPDPTGHQGVDLTGANVPGASLADANFARAKLTGAGLFQARLSGADLARADLTGTDLYQAVLYRTDLTHAHLTGADLRGATLTGANLTRALLPSADLSGADLTDADLTDADLTEADLTEAFLTRAQVSGADFSGAKLSNATWPLHTPTPRGWVLDPNTGLLARATRGGQR